MAQLHEAQLLRINPEGWTLEELEALATPGQWLVSFYQNHRIASIVRADMARRLLTDNGVAPRNYRFTRWALRDWAFIENHLQHQKKETPIG